MTICYIIAGESCVSVLDAEERAAKFWGAAAHDITMR